MVFIFSEILLLLATSATSLISSTGYLGVFLLMILESMVFPIPSELVMPFAGFLATTGTFTFIFVIVVSTLGSIVGSLISYYIGKYRGEAAILRFGKYVFLDEHDLELTHSWFAQQGEKTIFIARFIPVVRHLISIPAGIAEMNLRKFVIYTALGAGIWNTFLAYCGFLLGKNWGLVRTYTEPLSIIVAIILVIVAVWFVYRHMKHTQKMKHAKKIQSNKKRWEK